MCLGPIFGVEAYDREGVGFNQGLMGSLFVDGTTAEVLYQQTGTGFLVPVATVNFGEWNEFFINLDTVNKEYTILLNGQVLRTEPFIDGDMLHEITNIPLAAGAGGGDPASQALTGTAYFDNFIVFTRVPEPCTLVLVLLGLSCAHRRTWSHRIIRARTSR